MHWHEDLQFIYVLEGCIQIRTLNETVLLHEHEGIYINKSIVHLVEKIDHCVYKSFLFPDYFLSFYPAVLPGNWLLRLPKCKSDISSFAECRLGTGNFTSSAKTCNIRDKQNRFLPIWGLNYPLQSVADFSETCNRTKAKCWQSHESAHAMFSAIYRNALYTKHYAEWSSTKCQCQ